MTALNDLQETLTNGRFSQLPDRLAPIAAWAGTHHDTLQSAITMLAHFERQDELADLFIEAWPHVRDEQRFPRLKNEFAAQATEHIIYRYLANAEPPNPADATLHQQLATFFEIDPDGLSRTFAVLLNQDTKTWTIEAFPPAAQGEGERTQSRQQAQNLAYLLMQFVGFAHAEEQRPFCTTHLFRTLLPDYFALRRTGQLEPRQTLDDIRRGQRPILNQAPRHPLLPDPLTGERFLAKLLHFANPQPYKTAVFLTLLPAYCHFLQQHQLITATDQQQTVANFQSLQESVKTHLQDHPAASPL